MSNETRILFVRHGQSVANVDQVFAGQQYDAMLTKLGREQARLTAEYIAHNYKVDAVFTSDLIRARNTGLAIRDAAEKHYLQTGYVPTGIVEDANLPTEHYKKYEGDTESNQISIPFTTTDRFREIFEGEWARIPFTTIQETFKTDYDVWMHDIGNARTTGGETISHMAARVMLGMFECASANPGRTIVVASHATPVRAMVTAIQKAGRTDMKDVPWITNASITEFFVDATDVRKISLPDESTPSLEDEIWADFAKRARLGVVGYNEHLADKVTALPTNV